MERYGKDKDVKEYSTGSIRCLECGKENISDNKVCGWCGASLPLIYNREGRTVHWREPRVKARTGPIMRGWTRFVIILMFATAAFWILKWAISVK